MRTLVMTTGYNAIILNRWLPLLRKVAEYKGDVLVLDYGTINYGSKFDTDNDRLIQAIKKQDNIFVVSEVKKLSNIFIDRVRVYRDWLKENDRWKNYDVIMVIDCNDVIFHGPIQPLLDIAKDKLCYVKEHPSNLLRLWDDYYTRSFIQKEFKDIENNPIINGGMIVGPSECIMDLFNFELDMLKKYGEGPSDQLYLVLLIYHFKYPKALEIGYEWNYTHAVLGLLNDRHIGPRRAIFKDGKAYAVEDGRPIIIEHRTGTGFWFWQSPIGMEIIKSGNPISIMAEYENGIDYMKEHFAAERGLQQNYEWFRKFKYPACR